VQDGLRFRVVPTDLVSPQTGLASWYGRPFHGRRTASGEIYNMRGLTAAHRSLPMGTFVWVRHRHTGQSVVVRINDRGPFIQGRVIDLSWAAARRLGFEGLAPVVVLRLQPEETLSPQALAR
jgi:rare lipoprotein A